MKQHQPGTFRAMATLRLAAALTMGAMLPGCFGGMMVAAVGLEMVERQEAREYKRREKRISKLPPEEQAIVRLTNLEYQHGYQRKSVGEWLVDEDTMLNVTKFALPNGKRPGILERYDEHFSKFGYQRVTPPAAKAVRSYQLGDYRVDLRLESPSKLHQSDHSKAEDHFDLSVRVYSPRKAAQKRIR